MVDLFLIFWGISILFSIMVTPIYIYNNGVGKFSFFHILTLISCLFDNSHPNRYEVISHRGYDLHYPNNKWRWSSFHVPVGHPYVSFRKKCLSRPSAHFLIELLLCFGFFFLFCCFCCYCFELFIYLDINTWLHIWLANIFSHSVVCFFILMKVSTAMQKLLSLM